MSQKELPTAASITMAERMVTAAATVFVCLSLSVRFMRLGDRLDVHPMLGDKD